jgi:hypothetical protein
LRWRKRRSKNHAIKNHAIRKASEKVEADLVAVDRAVDAKAGVVHTAEAAKEAEIEEAIAGTGAGSKVRPRST